jgi:flavorubredoxin
LAQVIIVYDSKFGNTKLKAETVLEGINEVEGVEAVQKKVEQTDPAELLYYDLILIGSPNHYGGPTKDMKEFINRLENIEFVEKPIAVFDTYLGAGFFEKAVKRMEKTINERLPSLKVIVPGLSIRVEKSRGPIVEGELPKCREFGQKLTHQFKN